MKKILETYKKVKSIDWEKADVSFYVVKRKLVNREADYDVFLINIEHKLQKSIRKISVNKLKKTNKALEFNFNTTDLDDNVLGISTSETDFEKIIYKITEEEHLPLAENPNALLGAWMYITRLDIEGKPPLYSSRRISRSWTPKQVKNFINVIYKNSLLIGIGDDEIFKIDSFIDFFSFNGTIFIVNKSNFETALNFRTGMEKNRDEIIKELTENSTISNANDLSEIIGNNLTLLRTLSQVKKSGYYKSKAHMDNLIKILEERGFSQQYILNGKLHVTHENINSILHFLNNDWLRSPVNDEDFIVGQKHKL